MPVKGSSWLVLFALLPLAVQAAGLIGVGELVKDKPVKSFAEPYQLAASATVIYDKCAQPLAITQDQKAFLEARQKKLSQGYMKAFEDAYVERVRAPSSAEMKDDFMRYMNDTIAKPAMERTDKAITMFSCKHRSITALVDYFDQIEKTEAAGHQIPLTSYIDAQLKKEARKRAREERR